MLNFCYNRKDVQWLNAEGRRDDGRPFAPGSKILFLNFFKSLNRFYIFIICKTRFSFLATVESDLTFLFLVLDDVQLGLKACNEVHPRVSDAVYQICREGQTTRLSFKIFINDLSLEKRAALQIYVK